MIVVPDEEEEVEVGAHQIRKRFVGRAELEKARGAGLRE